MPKRSNSNQVLASVLFFVFTLMVPLSLYCETIDISISQKSKKAAEPTWTKAVADTCAAINAQLATITAGTSAQKVSQVIEDALKKIEAIKQEGRMYGVAVENVSVTLGGTPTMTIKLKYAN